MIEHSTALSPSYSYVLCGWRTASDIPLTDVPQATHAFSRTDVRITLENGPAPATNGTGRFVFEHSPVRSLLRIENVAQFEVRDGSLIRVWPFPGASQKDIEIFLLGATWSALCHQRGRLPLHASAIATDRGLAAFAGHSGAGKSTTAALMVSFGYQLVTDDILPIEFDACGAPGAWPYLRRLKLHAEPIMAFNLEPTGVVSERLDTAKQFVRPTWPAQDAWHHLERIYLVEVARNNSRHAIERVTGAEAVGALIDQTYHFQFIQTAKRHAEHLQFCSRLAARTAMYRLSRSSRAGLADLGHFLDDHLKQN